MILGFFILFDGLIRQVVHYMVIDYCEGKVRLGWAADRLEHIMDWMMDGAGVPGRP